MAIDLLQEDHGAMLWGKFGNGCLDARAEFAMLNLVVWTGLLERHRLGFRVDGLLNSLVEFALGLHLAFPHPIVSHVVRDTVEPCVETRAGLKFRQGLLKNPIKLTDSKIKNEKF